MFEPKLRLEHSDMRGEIWSLELPDGHELMLLHSVAGSWRGGHHHSCDEIVTLLSGRMRYHKRNADGHETIVVMDGGESSFNPAQENHLGEFLEDSWVVEWKFARKGDWTQSDYEPYRKQVRASADTVAA